MLVMRNLARAVVQGADTGTYILDIRDAANLHALLIEAQATTGAGVPAAHLIDDIDTVRLTKNGSEDVVAGSGNALASIAKELGVSWSGDNDTLVAGATQVCTIPILFGRSLNDPNHYLQTANIDSLQLRIDFSTTIGAAAFVTLTTAFTVTAVYSYDTPVSEYRGYYRTRVVDSFTAAAAGDRRIALPTGQALASVHLCTITHDAVIATTLTNIVYEANQGDRVFWSGASALMQRQVEALKGNTYWFDITDGAVRQTCAMSFFHDVMSAEQSIIPANTYKYLEIIATQGAAVPVQVLVRDVVS